MSVLHSDEFDDAGARPVAFHLPTDVDAQTVALAGDFNDWSTEEHLLHRQDDGSWRLVLRLPPGRYRFRYLVDGTRWENDWYADEYAANEFGGDDSVVIVPPVGDDGRDGGRQPVDSANAPTGTDTPVDREAERGNVVADVADYFVDDPDAPKATDVPGDLPPPPNA